MAFKVFVKTHPDMLTDKQLDDHTMTREEYAEQYEVLPDTEPERKIVLHLKSIGRDGTN